MKAVALLSPTRVLLLLSVFLVPASLHAEDFAVGIQASAVFAGGSGTNASNFDTWGGNLFGEMQIEQGTCLQLRAGRFEFPGSIEEAPNRNLDYGQAMVSYLFRENWFEYGFIGGVGFYRVRPNDADPGQIVIDKDEDVFGLSIGVLTVFRVNRHFDVRLEGLLHYVYTEDRISPIHLGVGAAYRF